jgi:hypothetical protein
MKTVYFYDGKERNKSYSVGLLASTIHSTYIWSRLNNYDEEIFEWPNKIPYPHWINSKGTLNIPTEFIIPYIRFVEKGTKLNSLSIDISKDNCLYEGGRPLTNKIFYNCEYLNKVFEKTGKYPIISFPKKKYILFHNRQSPEIKQFIRNTPVNLLNDFLEDLKQRYSDYKFYKIGESSKIDDKFDKVFPYFSNEIYKLFELVARASLFIGNESGPAYMSYMFDTPSIILQDKQTEENLKNSPIYDWTHKDNILRVNIKESFKDRREFYDRIIISRSS